MSLTAIDGETISGSTQSNFLGNGYYTRKGFTRAVNWVGPNPLGGNFAGWDDLNFIPIGAWLVDFDSSDTGFYSRMDDLGLNSMLPCAGSVSLANNVTFGKAAVVTDEVNAGGTISTPDDPGVIGVSTGEEPGSVADYNAQNSARTAWLATSDGPGRFGFYNYNHPVINSDIEGVIFPADMMTAPAADFITMDQYWFSGGQDAGDESSTRLKLFQHLYQTTPPTNGTTTIAQTLRGSHYGSVLDSMRKWLNSTTTKPILTWVENGSPYTIGTEITPSQLTWAVWATIVHGSRGIGYFNHTFEIGNPRLGNNNFNNNAYGGPGVTGTGIYAAVKDINRKCLGIASAINAPFDGYFVYGDMDTSGSIARSGFLTAVTSTNARSKFGGVDAACKWQPTSQKHYIFSSTREIESATNVPVTFRMIDQGQTAAVNVFAGGSLSISRGGAIPGGFCEFSDTFATAGTPKCYRID